LDKKNGGWGKYIFGFYALDLKLLPGLNSFLVTTYCDQSHGLVPWMVGFVSKQAEALRSIPPACPVDGWVLILA
jgi:hypothetical protein